MTRGRTGAQTAADVATHAGRAVLIELLFDSGALRLVAGPWDILIGADTYYASGALLSVHEHTEAADGTEGATFEMAGLDPAIFALVMVEPYEGRIARMLEQRFDVDDVAVGAPTVEYLGRIKGMYTTESVTDRRHTVTIQTEHYDAELERPREIRFNDAEQRRRYPADTGFQYAAAMVERTLTRRPGS